MSSLKHQLSLLEYPQACKLLGTEAAQLIRRGGEFEIDISKQLSLGRNVFWLNLENTSVTITYEPELPGNLNISCNSCNQYCIHMGAALSLVLEEKILLGLQEEEDQPLESLSENELLNSALLERKSRARTEKMEMVSSNPDKLWTDYSVSNHSSGKTYRVALRGKDRGMSYCSCPDFRCNTLGVCKHIFFTLDKVSESFDDKALNSIIEEIASQL